MDTSLKRMCLWTEGLIAPLLAILLIGCGSSDPANSKDDASTLDIVNRMIQRYQDAKAYTNQGEIKITYADGFPRTERMLISFARPNRLSFKLSGVEVRCNGKTYSASVYDPLSNNLHGQVLHRRAPREFTADNFLPDPILQEVVKNRARSTKRLYLTPLFLLLDAKKYAKEVRSFAKESKLDNATIDGKPCYRLTSESTVLWIDQQDYLLRRIELPDEKTRVSVDFTGARFVDKIPDEVFEPLSVDIGIPVGHFVQPPRYIPVELLGKRPDPFKFTDLEGKDVSQQEMHGRVNVLLWCIDDSHCQTALRVLSEMRRDYSTEEVRFYAVWLDPQLVDTRAIRDRFDSLTTDLSLVIDPHEDSKEVFRVSHTPTLLVLDSNGVAQYGEVGLNPNLGSTLPAIIDRVRSKVDVASEQLEKYARSLQGFEQDLTDAKTASSSKVIEIPNVEIKERTDPERLVLTKLWICNELTAPGNILTVDDAAEPMILVHDGFRTVVHVGKDGKVVKRHELDLPDQQAVTYLRTATDGNGRRYFAASQVFGQQIHIFDQDWKRLASYPEDKNDGIWDVQFHDLNKDNEPELYLGLWERPLIIRVSLDGQRSKGKRIFQPLSSFVVSPRNDLLILTKDGSVLRLNEFGQDPVQAGRLPVSTLYAADFQATPNAGFCGLAYKNDDTMIAVGISEKEDTEKKLVSLDVQWTYELSAKPFLNQIQFVKSGGLLDVSKGQWLFAQPDSSIHIVSDDGKFTDKFNYGKPLSGIAIAKFGSQNVLIVASEKELTAWRVSLKQPTAP